MGLDFSHCEAHWSYSGFKHFRNALWTAAGFEGNLYELYKHNGQDEAIDHPLYPLFNHSDCDGELSVAEMKLVEPALRELIDKLDWTYDRDSALLLCDGMRAAIEANEPLQFQ